MDRKQVCVHVLRWFGILNDKSNIDWIVVVVVVVVGMHGLSIV